MLPGFTCRAALSRARTRAGATDELWDGRRRHLVATSRSRNVAENLFARVIPVDATSTPTVRADGISSALRHWRQRGAPARSQLGREHRRERIAHPACRGPPQVAEGQRACVLLGHWSARHLGHGDWTFRNGTHSAPSLRVQSCGELSAISVETCSRHHLSAAGSSDAGSWGGSAPTRTGGQRDLPSRLKTSGREESRRRPNPIGPRAHGGERRRSPGPGSGRAICREYGAGGT